MNKKNCLKIQKQKEKLAKEKEMLKKEKIRFAY